MKPPAALIEAAPAARKRFFGALLAGLRPVREALELRDIFCFSGLGLIGFGLHLVSPPAAYIIVGALLFWLGVRRL